MQQPQKQKEHRTHFSLSLFLSLSLSSSASRSHYKAFSNAQFPQKTTRPNLHVILTRRQQCAEAHCKLYPRSAPKQRRRNSQWRGQPHKHATNATLPAFRAGDTHGLRRRFAFAVVCRRHPHLKRIEKGDAKM